MGWDGMGRGMGREGGEEICGALSSMADLLSSMGECCRVRGGFGKSTQTYPVSSPLLSYPSPVMFHPGPFTDLPRSTQPYQNKPNSFNTILPNPKTTQSKTFTTSPDQPY